MSHTILLDIHIAAGAVGLALGPVAMWRDTRALQAGRRPAGGVSAAYPWTVLVVGLSAIVLVARYRAELWWLGPTAVGLILMEWWRRRLVAARPAATSDPVGSWR